MNPRRLTVSPTLAPAPATTVQTRIAVLKAASFRRRERFPLPQSQPANIRSGYPLSCQRQQRNSIVAILVPQSPKPTPLTRLTKLFTVSFIALVTVLLITSLMSRTVTRAMKLTVNSFVNRVSGVGLGD